jgi:tetratricopeptide (TPR) repeat protein
MKLIVGCGLLLSYLGLSISVAYGGTLDKAQEAFINNKPQEAVPLLEIAVQQEPTNAQARLWLAIGYEQTGNLDRAIDTLQDMVTQGLGDQAVVLCDLGGNYARKGDDAQAIEYFTKSLSVKADYPNPYFNRAQANVRLKKYADARADYVKFMALAPQHAKVPEAKAMIGAIDEELTALETQRQAEATRQAAAEEQRATAEAQQKADAERKANEEIAQKAEEARRQQLLNSAFAGLNDAKDDSLTIGPGSESVQQQEDQFAREN